MAEKTISVSVLLCKEFHAEGSLWVAQCLEYDIAAQGKTMKTAVQAILQALREQADRDTEAGRKPFADFEKAPKDFWNQFESAEAIPSEVQPQALPPAWMIRAQEVRVC